MAWDSGRLLPTGVLWPLKCAKAVGAAYLGINWVEKERSNRRRAAQTVSQFLPGPWVTLGVELRWRWGCRLHPGGHVCSSCVQVEHHALLSTLQLMYTVGYSLSLISLLLALTLFLCLRWVEPQHVARYVSCDLLRGQHWEAVEDSAGWGRGSSELKAWDSWMHPFLF